MEQSHNLNNGDKKILAGRPIRLFPVNQIPNQPGYQWLTESALRHWIFNAEESVGSGGTIIPGNGFGPVIIRLGRKILIDLDQLDTWVEAHRLK